MASDKHIWVSFKSRFKSILCYTYGCKEELKSTRFCYVCWKLRSSSKNSVNHFVHFPRIDPIRQWICKLLFLGCVIIKVFSRFCISQNHGSLKNLRLTPFHWKWGWKNDYFFAILYNTDRLTGTYFWRQNTWYPFLNCTLSSLWVLIPINKSISMCGLFISWKAKIKVTPCLSKIHYRTIVDTYLHITGLAHNDPLQVIVGPWGSK